MAIFTSGLAASGSAPTPTAVIEHEVLRALPENSIRIKSHYMVKELQTAMRIDILGEGASPSVIPPVTGTLVFILDDMMLQSWTPQALDSYIKRIVVAILAMNDVGTIPFDESNVEVSDAWSRLTKGQQQGWTTTGPGFQPYYQPGNPIWNQPMPGNTWGTQTVTGYSTGTASVTYTDSTDAMNYVTPVETAKSGYATQQAIKDQEYRARKLGQQIAQRQAVTQVVKTDEDGKVKAQKKSAVKRTTAPRLAIPVKTGTQLRASGSTNTTPNPTSKTRG